MKSAKALFFFTLLFLLIQSVAFENIKILNVKPDFTIVFLALYGLSNNSISGSVSGFAAGLVQDILSTGVLGVTAMTRLIAGFLSGFLGEKIFRKGYLINALVIFIISVIDAYAAMIIKEYLSAGSLSVIRRITADMAVSGLYNSAAYSLLIGAAAVAKHFGTRFTQGR